MKKLVSKARITEVDDLSDRLLTLFRTETALAEDSFLKPLFAELKGLSDKITEAIKRDKIFSELEQADIVRDEAVKKLFKVVDGYSSIPLENLSQAGSKLKTILKKYGISIIYDNYASESSLIESLLLDLSQEQASISLLAGVEESIAELRAAQTAFHTKQVEYERNLSTEKQAESATRIKKPLLQLINHRLLPYLSTMKMVDSAKYGNFANATEEIIGSMNTTVLQRKKKVIE